MLKSDLVSLLVERRNLPLRKAEQAIEIFFSSMKDALARGENIEIRGLGSFHVKNYKAYEGRNPKTSEIIHVAAKRGVLFRTGKQLRDRLNGSSNPSSTDDAEDAA